MVRRAFSLVELLVVVAILAVLAALRFPVFARSKERAKITDCQSRLRQVALGLQMYRSDHEGQAWLEYLDSSGGYTTAGRYRFPWNNWLPLEPYLKDGRMVWCPLPGRDPTTAYELYHLRQVLAPGLRKAGDRTTRHVLEPEPGRVVVFCANHTTGEIERKLPLLAAGNDLFKGRYPFAREDGSAGLAQSSQIESWYLLPNLTWQRETPGAGVYSTQVWRFPGEPWPPSLPGL